MAQFQNEEPRWLSGQLLLVCTRCFERYLPEDPSALQKAREWRLEIKSELAAKGANEVRAVETSCLGVCPQGKLTLAKTGKDPRCVSVEPGCSAKDVVSWAITEPES